MRQINTFMKVYTSSTIKVILVFLALIPTLMVIFYIRIHTEQDESNSTLHLAAILLYHFSRN